MLRLKMATDKRWAELAENKLKEALIDHAYCEQKAASSAISMIVNYPEYSEMVTKLGEVAIEEMEHFNMVHEKILARGWELGKERKDEYVNRLSQFFVKSSNRKERMIQRLLLAAMIEARSCERFRLLSKTVDDKELSDFYNELVKSEASHYQLFLGFAKEYGSDIMDIDKVWDEFLMFESNLVSEYGNSPLMHG